MAESEKKEATGEAEVKQPVEESDRTMKPEVKSTSNEPRDHMRELFERQRAEEESERQYLHDLADWLLGELPNNFKTRFPLISSKLDTNEKKRTFTLAAACIGVKDIETLMKFANFLEYITGLRFECKVDFYTHRTPGYRSMEASLVSTSQTMYLVDLLFPGLKIGSSQISDNGIAIFDWR